MFNDTFSTNRLYRAKSAQEVCPITRQQFTCPKGHLSEKYRHRVRVRARARVRFRVRFSVKFRNLHNYISDR